jgi:hypothetical protein
MVFENISASLSDIIQIASILIGLGATYGRITSLDKRVEKHNKVIERVFKLEESVGKNDVNVLSQKISDLDRRVTNIEAEGCNNICLNNHKTF